MAPENDIDYSLSRVPDEAKQPFWRILFIRIGAICCVSQLMLGAAPAGGLTFWDAFLNHARLGAASGGQPGAGHGGRARRLVHQPAVPLVIGFGR